MSTSGRSGTKPRRTQTERSSATQARLLEATIQLLIERGYAHTSTNDVAKRAGLSRGAQIHHFPRKVDLVIAAIRHLAIQHREGLMAKIKLLPDDATRTEIALLSLWEIYRSPLFTADMELRNAARTDPDLRKAYKHFFETIVVPTLDGFYAHLLGPVASNDKALLDKINMCTAFVHGLAVAHGYREESWCEGQFKLFAQMLTFFIEQARSRPGNYTKTPNEKVARAQ